MRKIWVGAIFLFATVFLYALIGIYGRTSNASGYYVAGRKIPPMYNGMAVAADWILVTEYQPPQVMAATPATLAGPLCSQVLLGKDGFLGAFGKSYTRGLALLHLNETLRAAQPPHARYSQKEFQCVIMKSY